MWQMSRPDGTILTVDQNNNSGNMTDEDLSSSVQDGTLEGKMRRMIKESEQRMQEQFEKMMANGGAGSGLTKQLSNDDLSKLMATFEEEHEWKQIGDFTESENFHRGTVSDEEKEKRSFEFEEDVYAILASNKWNTKPFWFALVVIFVFQTSLSVLLILDQIHWTRGFNPMMLPADVPLTVRMSQGLAIFIALFSQADLLQGIESLFNGIPHFYQGPSDRFESMTEFQWNASCIIRILQGSLNLFAAFVLIIQTETVFDVLLDFLGVAFVSDLDDIAFGLAANGYFGGSVKKCAETQRETKFYQEGRKEGMVQIVICQKKVMHVFTSIMVLIIMYCFFGIFSYGQLSGVYSVQTLQVEFGDEVIPYLGLYNGCYQVYSESSEGYGRLIYRQLGFEEEGGKFGFCKDIKEGEGGWTFWTGPIRDPCDDFIVRSGETDSFDILEAIDTRWYTADDLPLDLMEGDKIEDSTTECGTNLFVETRESCATVDLAVEGVSSIFFGSLEADLSLADRDFLDATISHPIYYDVANPADRTSFQLALFTGRRWVLTDTTRVKTLRDMENITLEDLEDFFYVQQGFNLFDQDQEWVISISEIVELARDDGTPLRLEWYPPRREGNTTLNFPAADLGRPEDAVFVCIFCNTVNNPCFNEGVCNDDTGFCDCAHGANGPLCQDRPLGNGVCNEFFNNAENEYDGGDCCGGTCEGPQCGVDQLSTPFGIDVTENTTQILLGAEPQGYSNCVDPTFATFRLDVRPHRTYNDTMEQFEFEFPSVFIECDNFIHMQTPSFLYSEKEETAAVFTERIRVPHGASCTMTYSVYNHYSSASLMFDGQEDALRSATVPSRAIEWTVPGSQCVVDLFTKQSGEDITLDALGFVGNDALADNMCRRLQQDITNTAARGKLFERYALGLLLDTFIEAEEIEETIPTDWDHCNGWVSDNFVVTCDSRGSGVVSLHISASKIPPADLEILSNLKHLPSLKTLSMDNANALDGNVLDEIPAEIGSLTNLKSLQLHGLGISSLPGAIGQLSALETLDVRNNKLRSIPSEIGNLGALQSLEFDSNLILPLPTTIGNLLELKYLSGTSNNLGSIPSEIGHLTLLSTIRLGNNYIGNMPSEIGNLQSLKTIDMPSNFLNGLPSEIGNLQLEALNIASNKISDLPTELGNLAALQSFNASGNELESYEGILIRNLTVGELLGANFTSEFSVSSVNGTFTLANFTMENTAVPETPEGNLTDSNFMAVNTTVDLQILPGMDEETNVTTNFTGLLTSLPSEIGRLQLLTSLDLQNNNFTLLPSEIGNLGALSFLDLATNALFKLPSEIGQLGALEHLNLSSNILVSEDPEVVLNSTALPTEIGSLGSLKTLDLSFNNLTYLPSEIGSLSVLNTLLLPNNTLSLLPAEIGNLTGLSTLLLQNNMLLLLPTEIGNVTGLTYLDASGNDLTGVPSEIGSLGMLSSLLLQDNMLSRLPSEMGNLTGLTYLDVSGNDLRELPDEMGNLTAISFLNVSYNERIVAPTVTNVLLSPLVNSLETCSSDSATTMSPCGLLCCKLGPAFCPEGCELEV